jgi:hypothetical protein
MRRRKKIRSIRGNISKKEDGIGSYRYNRDNRDRSQLFQPIMDSIINLLFSLKTFKVKYCM